MASLKILEHGIFDEVYLFGPQFNSIYVGSTKFYFLLSYILKRIILGFPILVHKV